MTTVRYSGRSVAKARELRDQGLSLEWIAAVIESDCGHRPHRDTVAAWTSEASAERMRARSVRNKRKASARERRVFKFAAVDRKHHGRLAVDPTAPLPLAADEAVAVAAALRQRGNVWSWSVLAEVMEEYHGLSRCTSWWARKVKALGVPSRPRGNAYESPGRSEAESANQSYSPERTISA